MKLDIGCGGNTIDSDRTTPNIRGDINIDINKPNIKINNFIQASAEALPFREATFTQVTMYDVIEHLNSPGYALKEIHRTLRPNGHATIGTCNALYLPKIIRAALRGKYTVWPNHIATWGATELEQICQCANLQTHVEHTTYLQDPTPLHYRILIWLCPFPALKHRQIVAKCLKK